MSESTGDTQAPTPITGFGYTGHAVTYTVPATGLYEIVATGASGGNGGDIYGVFGVPLGVSSGGPGARISGAFELTQGEVLTIDVGGRGTDGGTFADRGGPRFGSGGGGGGGTFVVGPGNTPLVVAGGGGGGGGINKYDDGGPGLTGMTGGSSGSGQAGGTEGAGGSGASSGGGGGGGFNSNGNNGSNPYNGGGGYPGLQAGGSFLGTFGGFGGGGGAGNSGRGGGGGGGGGGYSGGGGGASGDGNGQGGGGGGSFDAGTNPHVVQGQNRGNGTALIYQLPSASPDTNASPSQAAAVVTSADTTANATANQTGAITPCTLGQTSVLPSFLAALILSAQSPIDVDTPDTALPSNFTWQPGSVDQITASYPTADVPDLRQALAASRLTLGGDHSTLAVLHGMGPGVTLSTPVGAHALWTT